MCCGWGRSAKLCGLMALGLCVCLLLGTSCINRGSGDIQPDPEADDDDAAGGDDDDTGGGGDDDTGDDDDTSGSVDPPVFLAGYDFTLVLLSNDISGEYSGDNWSWGGSLDQNEQAFLVRGYFDVPGLDSAVYMEVSGNFLGDTDGTSSESCLTGLGEDDDPNLPDQGIEFAWYGCQDGAPAPAIDRSGTYQVAYTTHGDNCNGWGGPGAVGTWSETWSFSGRRLIVARDGLTGYGIVSDDGNVFRFSTLEQESPGRSLKVIGDFTSPTGTTEARATGSCHTKKFSPGGVIDLDY